MNCGFQIRRTSVWILWEANLDSRFMRFVFRINRGIKFWNPCRGLRHWQTELFFNYDISILNFVRNQQEKDRKHYFVNFCFVGVLKLSLDGEWWGGTESFISNQLRLCLLFIASAKIPEREGSISPSSIYGSGVNLVNEEERWIWDSLLLP